MSRPPDPERIAAAIVDAHVRAITVALEALRPQVVAIVRRVIADSKDSKDTCVVENLFDKRGK
jgi:hypothetical protein